ncbi:MAG TPA: hypothetical protein VIZ87_08470 [Terrimicrobium sp.]
MAVQSSQDADARHHGRAIEFDYQEQRFDRGLPFLENLLALGSFWIWFATSLRVTSWRPRGRGMGSSKARDQSAMMQSGRANVGAAMIAHGAKHPPLQLPKGQVVGGAWRRTGQLDLE